MDEQYLQFAAEENAKILWKKKLKHFLGNRILKINVGNELKNLEMKTSESANDYIAHDTDFQGNVALLAWEFLQEN